MVLALILSIVVSWGCLFWIERRHVDPEKSLWSGSGLFKSLDSFDFKLLAISGVSAALAVFLFLWGYPFK
jgi:hypothetical protein